MGVVRGLRQSRLLRVILSFGCVSPLLSVSSLVRCVGAMVQNVGVPPVNMVIILFLVPVRMARRLRIRVLTLMMLGAKISEDTSPSKHGMTNEKGDNPHSNIWRRGGRSLLARPSEVTPHVRVSVA